MHHRSSVSHNLAKSFTQLCSVSDVGYVIKKQGISDMGLMLERDTCHSLIQTSHSFSVLIQDPEKYRTDTPASWHIFVSRRREEMLGIYICRRYPINGFRHSMSLLGPYSHLLSTPRRRTDMECLHASMLPNKRVPSFTNAAKPCRCMQ